MFPLTITNDHLFKYFDHLLDVKTKKCFNFFNGDLVAGFQLIHKNGKTVGNIKTNTFQHFILGTNVVVQAGRFDANCFSKITH